MVFKNKKQNKININAYAPKILALTAKRVSTDEKNTTKLSNIDEIKVVAKAAKDADSICKIRYC